MTEGDALRAEFDADRIGLEAPTRGGRVIVLAIDPGATSGWSLYTDSAYVASGAVTSLDGRRAVIGALVNLAQREGHADLRAAPAVAVVESWTNGSKGNGRWTPATMIGLGANRGRWLEQLALAGMTERRIVSVVPATWRAVLAPMRRGTTEQAKASACFIAKGIAKREVGPDEAEAVCIGRWGCASPTVVGLVQPRKRQRRA